MRAESLRFKTIHRGDVVVVCEAVAVLKNWLQDPFEIESESDYDTYERECQEDFGHLPDEAFYWQETAYSFQEYRDMKCLQS